jgi:hypothetical protein
MNEESQSTQDKPNFSDVGVDDTKPSPVQSNDTVSHDGFRGGLLRVSVLSWAVFIINLTATIYFSTSSNSRKQDSPTSASLFTGDCNKVKSLGQWAHLVINILSTALLGASNYGLQVGRVHPFLVHHHI